MNMQQEAFIKNNHNSMTIADMASKLNKSNTTITRWLKELCITKLRSKTKKTDVEGNSEFFVHDKKMYF
jgi:predicted transcriptional regulator